MARLLVVSRSMALAMRLADAHEVIEFPMERATQLAPGDDIDAVVLDVGEPTAAIQALDRLRGAGYTTPVLVVSGYQPSWAGLVAIDLPAVVVVPLPITKAALLHGVDELTRGRPNRAPAPPPRGWNGPRPTFVPAPPPVPQTVQAASPTAFTPPAVETTSWTALVAPSWNELTGTASPPPQHGGLSPVASGLASPPDPAGEPEPDDEPEPRIDNPHLDDTGAFDVMADLTDPDTVLPAAESSAASAPAATRAAAATAGQGGPVAGSGWPAVPFTAAPWALHQASGEHRGRPQSGFAAHPADSPEHAAVLQRPEDRLSVERAPLAPPEPEVAVAVGWPDLVEAPASGSAHPAPPALTGFERPLREQPAAAEPAPDPVEAQVEDAVEDLVVQPSTDRASVDDEPPQDAAPQGTAPHEVAPQHVEPQDAEPQDAEPQDAEPQDAEPQDAEPQDAWDGDPAPESVGRVIDLDAVARGGGWAAQDFDWWRPLPEDAEPEPTATDVVDTRPRVDHSEENASQDPSDAEVWVTDDEVWVTDDVPTADVPTAGDLAVELRTGGMPPASSPIPLPVAPEQQLTPPPLPVVPPPLPVRVRGAVQEAPPPFEAFPAPPRDATPVRGHPSSAPTVGVASAAMPASPAAIDTSLFEPTDDTWQRQLAAATAAAKDRGEAPPEAPAPSPAPEPAPPSYTLRSAQEVSESIAARRALLGRPDLVPAPSMLSRRLAGRTPSTTGLFSPAAAPTPDVATVPPTLEEPADAGTVHGWTTRSETSDHPSRDGGTAAAPLRVPVPTDPVPDVPGSPAEVAAADATVDDHLPAAALVSALGERFGELFGVGDTAQVLADEILDRVRAEAVAVVVADGTRWRVAGGIGLRPLERRLALPADHWLIAEVSDDGHAVLISDTDAIRPSLAGAPLAAWHYLLAVPVPGHQAIVVLARGPQADPFETADVARLAPAVREAAALLRSALQTRTLARRMASLRDLAGPLG